MEKRILAVSELRASKSGDQLKVSGYAAKYGVISHDLGGFRERIKSRAFDKVLATNPDVVATFNHNNDIVLGRTTSGTLQLRGTDQGLQFNCDLPNTQSARDLHESVSRGDINGCSFAFELGERGVDDDWTEEEIQDEIDLGLRSKTSRGKVLVRTIKNFRKLHDVSLVTSPAYPGTEVDARNLVAAEVRSYVERAAKQLEKTEPEIKLKSVDPELAKMFAEGAASHRKRNLLSQV